MKNKKIAAWHKQRNSNKERFVFDMENVEYQTLTTVKPNIVVSMPYKNKQSDGIHPCFDNVYVRMKIKGSSGDEGAENREIGSLGSNILPTCQS